jgi:hypothetical protein
MSIKEKIVRLEQAVLFAQRDLAGAYANLNEAKESIENHVYKSLEDAENCLMSEFENQAFEDCEGSGNCGAEEYTQDFIVDGKEYTAIGNFSYDRHDKQYYYIDERSYSYVEKV